MEGGSPPMQEAGLWRMKVLPQEAWLWRVDVLQQETGFGRWTSSHKKLVYGGWTSSHMKLGYGGWTSSNKKLGFGRWTSSHKKLGYGGRKSSLKDSTRTLGANSTLFGGSNTSFGLKLKIIPVATPIVIRTWRNFPLSNEQSFMFPLNSFQSKFKLILCKSNLRGLSR